MSDQKLKALKATALFGSCTDKQLELVGRVTDRAHMPAGRVIVGQNTVPAHMVILITGKAVVEADGVELAELGPGDVVGELALIDNERASATVTTTEDSTVWVIGHAGFKPVWDENPEMSKPLLQAVVQRLRAANQLAI